MKEIIYATILLLCVTTGYAYTADEVSGILNQTAADLGFKGIITYNADTGNMFILPQEGSDIPLDAFCLTLAKQHPGIFVRFMFKADPYGYHTAYECQCEQPKGYQLVI